MLDIGISEGAGPVKTPLRCWLFRTSVEVRARWRSVAETSLRAGEGAWCGSATAERAQSHTRLRHLGGSHADSELAPGRDRGSQAASRKALISPSRSP